jgi:DNA-binding response OmpR family regulator
MKNLKYNILFIENDTRFVESTKLHIEPYLEKLGFKLVTVHKLGEDFKADEIEDSTDLILLDLNLNDNIKGSDLIPKIRSNQIMADILFYSGATESFKEQLESMSVVDGVYFCYDRTELNTKIKNLISKSIKKHQTVSNLRGLVISEAIDLEAKMTQVIIKFFGLLGRPREEIFYRRILAPDVLMLGKKSFLIHSICKQLDKELNEELQNCEEDEVLQKQQLIEDIANIYSECKNIKKEIIDIRNILSHVQPMNSNSNTLKSNFPGLETPITIDNDWCIITRKNLIKHADNLDKLLDRI